MILCACFYIDKTEWFEEQFLYSRHLYNQGRYVINNQTGFIYGRRQIGSYLVKDIDGNIISSNISYKRLNLIEKRKGWIVDFKQS